MIRRLHNDLRHGLRQLLARPGFTLAAILTLALGIGANTLVFTLIDGVYLRGLPYRDAAALLDVYGSSRAFGGGVDSVSIPDYLDLRAGVPAFADTALYTGASFNLVAAGAPERLRGLRATPSLFSTLGVEAALGRVFAADDAVPGRDHVVVLGAALWRNRFGADPGVIGRDLRLDGESWRVIGVLPEHFMFPRADIGFYVPFAFSPAQRSEDERGVNYSAIVARLAPGATAAQVDAQMAAVIRHNVERLGGAGGDGSSYAKWIEDTGFSFGARPLRELLSGANARELGILQFAVALVLLIVLANVANLLLTRLSARRAELATRSALGARRFDIARALLAESALLAAGGALLGTAGAWAGVRIVASSGLLPGWAVFALDARTLGFTVALAALAMLAFGLAPALLAGAAAPQAMLRDSARMAGGGRMAARVRATLVVVQIALALALLAGVGLLLRSFANATAQSPGFRSANVLTAHLALPQAKYPDAAARARAVRRMLDAARALPGVDAAGLTTKLPFGGENVGIVFRIEGRGVDAMLPHASWRSVDEDFFRTLGIPLLRGRAFTSADWDEHARNIVVDAAFAEHFFPRGDVLGKRITLGSSGDGDAWTIIGVAGAVKHFDLTAPADKPTFYFDYGAFAQDSLFLALHTAVAPSALAQPLRAAIRSVDAEQPLFDIRPLDERIDSSLAGRRVPLQLLGVFAACALLLAAIGIYAVLAFSVQQRTGEIGLRMAIGANAARVRGEILAGAARLLAAGIGCGVLAALATGFALRTRLFGVAPVDLPTLAAVAAVLVGVALAACWLPARRAARLDPIVALRHE
jgi:predicted permease